MSKETKHLTKISRIEVGDKRQYEQTRSINSARRELKTKHGDWLQILVFHLTDSIKEIARFEASTLSASYR